MGVDLLKIYVVYLFECVLFGYIMCELIENDCVVGGINEVFIKVVVEFYCIFVEGEVLEIMLKMVEMVKLIENVFRDVNIVFVNEFFMFVDDMNIDVYELIKLVNYYLCVNIL